MESPSTSAAKSSFICQHPAVSYFALTFTASWATAFLVTAPRIGVSFGILAGFLEEIGWMGFAYPRLRQRFAVLPAAAILGLFWGLWHAPVIDFLGSASPHGKALPAFFAVFVAAMAAMRVLIAWFYERTQSIALAQLVHLSSTGALVVFSPPTVSPLQEATWYALYAAALWLLVLLLTTILPPATQPTEW